MKRLHVKHSDGCFYLTEDYDFMFQGVLYTISSEFGWNGSTCSFTTGTNLEASLIHDYLLRKFRHLGRGPIDKEYKKYCLQNGMNKRRANYLYKGIKMYAFISGGK